MLMYICVMFIFNKIKKMFFSIQFDYQSEIGIQPKFICFTPKPNNKIQI